MKVNPLKNSYQTQKLDKQFYSRRKTINQKHNLKEALLFSIASIIVLVFLILFGISAITSILKLLNDMKQGINSTESTDTIPPIAPMFDQINKYTNKDVVEITGRTEPGANVFLVFNGKTSKVLANKEGNFRNSFNLVLGENSLYAFAQDYSGNKSANSETVLIIYDNIPPEIEITKPIDKSEFFGNKEKKLEIIGKTEPETKVTINGRYVFVAKDGSFSYTTILTEGENKFVARSEDQAGNFSEKEFAVSFVP